MKSASAPYPYAFFQGEIVPIEKAQISIMTNSLHYGVGIFGGIKAFPVGDKIGIFRLDDHLERLNNSVTILGFPFEFDLKQTKEIILNLAQKNNLEEISYIRPLIYRSDTRLSPDIAGDYNLAIYMMRMPNYFDENKGIEVCVSSWQRNSDSAIPPRTKATGGYINSTLAINEARQSGYESAIMLDKNGHVSEGAVMNIFLAKQGKLITPSVDSDILEGITRRTVMELAEEIGIEIEQRLVDRSELYTADEAFFTGTAANITWCKSIDKTVLGSQKGRITEKIAKAFKNLPDTHKELFTLLN
ncbi:MAG TPA: branched-chain amino acid transaminase [Patescibacteria group bacterium]|nr:branched-chain amino acid transaminase [Patescibacteria group bacterium]